MSSRFPSPVTRLVVILISAIFAAALVVIFTPRQWQSTARLVVTGDAFNAEETITAVHSGAVLSMLGGDPVLLAALGIDPGPSATPALSLMLSTNVTVVTGEDEVWLMVRNPDGNRAEALALALVEATGKAQIESRNRLLNERIRTVEWRIAGLTARIENLVDTPADVDSEVAAEVRRARIRETASRLATAEEDRAGLLSQLADESKPWIVADPPVPFQHAVPRRLAPAIVAGVATPAFLVCVFMLFPGRKSDS